MASDLRPRRWIRALDFSVAITSWVGLLFLIAGHLAVAAAVSTWAFVSYVVVEPSIRRTP